MLRGLLIAASLSVTIAIAMAARVSTSATPARSADQTSAIVFTPDGTHAALVKALLERSRVLQDSHFRIPADLYRQFLLDTQAGGTAQRPCPVAFALDSGRYHMEVAADGAARLTAEIELRVFDPAGVRRQGPLPLLGADLAWQDIQVNGKPAELAVLAGQLCLLLDASAEAGLYRITVSAPIKPQTASLPGGRFEMTIPRTAQTFFVFDSPKAWQVSTEPARPRQIVGDSRAGTHGQIALSPRSSLQVDYAAPQVQSEKPVRYELSGDVAWNIDADVQQVTAALKVRIAGSATDKIVLLLSDKTQRAAVTGPEVRDVQIAPGRATITLRGKVLGQTPLTLKYELPLGEGNTRQLGTLNVENGRWTEGTLTVTNTAGSSEIFPAATSGLKELALSEVRSSAAAILSGPAVMAYEIISREFTASAEVLSLAAGALRQTLADLAHYEVFAQQDGRSLCRVRYEIRNRTRQFLRVDLPAGAMILLARVSDKSCPISPLAGEGGPAALNSYLLPLEKSRSGVLGLVSFPVEIVYLADADAAMRDSQLAVPLPRIDLPIAYAWGEAYLPSNLDLRKWSGPMRPVEQFSSQIAKASLDYGYGELAEAISHVVSPKAAPRPTEAAAAMAATVPMLALSNGQQVSVAAGSQSLTAGAGNMPLAGLLANHDGALAEHAASQPIAGAPLAVVSVPARPSLGMSHAALASSSAAATNSNLNKSGAALLARNYYRKGVELYDKGEYDKAIENFKKVGELAPESNDWSNARNMWTNARSDEDASKLVIPDSGTVMAGGQKVPATAPSGGPGSDSSGVTAARPGGAGEKLAKLEVDKEMSNISRGIQQKQEGLLEEAKKLSASGRLNEAKNTLIAAQEIAHSLNDSKAKDEIIASLEAVRAISKKRATGYRREFEDLKRSGKAAQAMKIGRQLRELDPSALSQKDLDELAVESVRSPENQRGAQPAPNAASQPVSGGKVSAWSADGITSYNAQANWEADIAQSQPSPAGQTFGTVHVAFAPGTSARVRARDRLAPVVRRYDIRDLITNVKDLGGLVNGSQGDGSILTDGTDAGSNADHIIKSITSAIDPQSWQQGSITLDGGTLRIIQTGENHEKVAYLLRGLKETRGPQVEKGFNFAQQQAKGLKLENSGQNAAGDGWAGGSRFPDSVKSSSQIDWQQAREVPDVDRREFARFVESNYDWQLHDDGRKTVAGTFMDDVQVDLLDKLQRNLGQKVSVSSVNFTLTAGAATALGISFQPSANGRATAIIDEAQLRSLIELQAGRGQGAWGKRRQDTIVGSDALLANNVISNTVFAGDTYNGLIIEGNTLNLPHDKYILMDNGDSLTAVGAAPMQFWTEAAKDVLAVDVPQNIEVPRLGQVVKFEARLLEPTDDLTLRAGYEDRKQ